jgi:hypothetical protein
MRASAVRPIDRLTAEWEHVCRGPESRVAVRLLASAEPDVALAGAADLGELVTMLRAAIGDRRATWAPRLFQAMLRSQSVHPLVSRAILQALLPGLVAVARRLSWGAGGDWSDGGAFFGDLLTTAWEVVTEWSGDDRAYAVLDLLSAIRCRMRRQILRHRTEREVAVGPAFERVHDRGTVTIRSDLEVLAQAIDESCGTDLDPMDAAVLYGHRVLGYSMSELARMTGRSRRFLTEHRQRAEHELCKTS